MVRFFLIFSIFIFKICHAENTVPTFAERLAEWKSRANTHEDNVAYLLSQPPLQKSNFDIPVKPTVPMISDDIDLSQGDPQVQTPFIPVPEYNVEQDNDINVSKNTLENDDLEDLNQSVDNQEGINNAYAELYDTDRLSKHEGFYIGLISGVVFPMDVTIRKPSGLSLPKNTSYKAENGYLIGGQVGYDFGMVRVEADYSFQSFDSNYASNIIEASIHNVFSRFILEKELNELFDLRGGLGMGMGIVDFEGMTDYLGTGFAYDFLLGVGYRLSKDLSLQFDYRYYLTAASEDYDHVKTHTLLLSVNMDL